MSYINGFVATFVLLLVTCGPAVAAPDNEPPVTVNVKRLSLDTALSLAKAAIEKCREQDIQVAVTVVDRGGHPQVVLRDVLAMSLALKVSRQKAYTAMSFNTPTSLLAKRLTSPLSVAKVSGVLPAAGGLPIVAAGSVVGGVGVSGAPSGKTDEQCAKAGIDAIRFDLAGG